MHKRALSQRIWLSIIGCTLITLLVVVVAISQFFSRFYIQQKRHELQDYTLHLVEALLTAGSDTSQVPQTSFSTISAVVVNAKGQVVQTVRRGHMRSHSPAFRPPLDLIQQVLSGNSVWLIGDQGSNDTILLVGEPIISQQNSQQNVQGAVFTSAPFEPIDQAISSALLVVYGIGAFGVLVSIGVSLWLSRHISKPIRALQQATVVLRNGNYHHQVDIRTKDELQDLGEAFNDLSQRLNLTITSLSDEKDNLTQLVQQRREFMANVAHELRTPLSIVKAYIEAVRDGMVENETQRQEYMSIIDDEISRLNRLVEQLLSSHVRPQPQHVDIAHLLRQGQQEMLQGAKQKGISLIVDVDEALNVVGVRDQLLQVVLNLLDNAIKYGYEESKVVLRGRKCGDRVCVDIHNWGDVLSKEEQQLIFQRFYRGDRGSVSGGTGLGLAIAKTLVEDHQGQLSVTSNQRDGTTFRFCVPAL